MSSLLDRDRVQPGAELTPRIEAPHPPPDSQERLLDNVFRILLVARHTVRQAKHTAAMQLDQHTEAVRLAGAGLLDGRRLARLHPVP